MQKGIMLIGNIPEGDTSAHYGEALLAVVDVVSQATGHTVPQLLTDLELAYIRQKNGKTDGSYASRRGN